MKKTAVISSFVILLIFQSAFANVGDVKFCNDASSIAAARIIIYDADKMYGGLEAVPGQCNVKSMMDLPGLIEVRVFYGNVIRSASYYTRLSNSLELKILHKNYYLPNGKLGETTVLLA